MTIFINDIVNNYSSIIIDNTSYHKSVVNNSFYLCITNLLFKSNFKSDKFTRGKVVKDKVKENPVMMVKNKKNGDLDTRKYVYSIQRLV